MQCFDFKKLLQDVLFSFCINLVIRWRSISQSESFLDNVPQFHVPDTNTINGEMDHKQRYSSGYIQIQSNRISARGQSNTSAQSTGGGLTPWWLNFNKNQQLIVSDAAHVVQGSISFDTVQRGFKFSRAVDTGFQSCDILPTHWGS